MRLSLSLFHDGIRLLKCLTFRKAFNLVQLVGSYLMARISRKAVQKGLPYAMSVEVTTHCNLRCTECPSGLRLFTRPTGRIDPQFYREIIDQVKNHLLYLTLYFQGEPYLHPQFLELVRYAADAGIYTATSTNGHNLSMANAYATVDSGLNRIIVSLDGLDQTTYSTYRVGGNVETVKEGLRNLVKAKKERHSATPYIILQFIVFAHNRHQLEVVKAFGKEVGVDEVQIKSAQIYDFDKGSQLLTEDSQFSRYEHSSDGSWQIRSRLPNRCWRMWSASVVTWDGKVVPCCFDKDADHRMGEMEETNFRQIWTAAHYDRFRQQVFSDRKQIEICRNCSEGL